MYTHYRKLNAKFNKLIKSRKMVLNTFTIVKTIWAIP